ncbi:MAG: hypothetical protein ACI81R_003561, partial [Bradymonadia bacterium]
MRSALRFALCTGLFGLVAACGADTEPDTDSNDSALRESQGLALTFDTLADTDVAGFLFTATEVDCATGVPVAPANVITATEDLEDMYLPGGNTTFENAPLDADSNHLFSDHYFWLPEGCYDVVAQPLDIDGNFSRDCFSAHMDNVQVFDGQTTEILLLSQCEGDPAGGLDVIVAINHPPQIIGLSYDPSKFICEDTTTVCLTIWDPDNDPLDIDWFVPPGATLVSQTVNELEDATEFCAEFAFEGPGSYNFGADVFDLGYDADGNLVTMEELLILQGDAHPSRDSIRFPVHVLNEDDCIDTCECPQGFEITPAGDECIRVTETDIISSDTTYTACPAVNNSNYGVYGGQFPGGLIETNSFFGDNTDLSDRLNDAGVWACDSESVDIGENLPMNSPVGEWIGFSICLDLEEPGDYMVGMAADNQTRFSINGNPFFSLLGANVINFRYWWMNTVSLGSGLNIIEMEGYNNGQIAAFGADIYGPYAPGTVSTDADMSAADYEGNILWSTLDMIGTPFLMGESSGFSCPDGFVVNTCGSAP